MRDDYFCSLFYLASDSGHIWIMIAIRNTLTGNLFATYGTHRDIAEQDCAYMNRTEIKYGRPAIFVVEEIKEAK